VTLSCTPTRICSTRRSLNQSRLQPSSGCSACVVVFGDALDPANERTLVCEFRRSDELQSNAMACGDILFGASAGVVFAVASKTHVLQERMADPVVGAEPAFRIQNLLLVCNVCLHEELTDRSFAGSSASPNTTTQALQPELGCNRD
jgi:hypothetical protein